jgi:cytochrome c oxidase subunit 2
MSYPEENVTVGGAQPTIVVPQGQTVYFTVTSSDVIHGFAVPELGLKQDAVPNQNHTIRTTPLETGTYQGYCTEYCGVSHSQMYFSVEVVPQDQYQQFLADQRSGDDGGSANASGNATSANGSTNTSSNASAVGAPVVPAAGGN